MRRSLSILVVMLVLAAVASADELVTTDGKKRDVTVLRVTDEGVVVKAAAGEKTYGFDEIEAKCAYGFMKRLVEEKEAKGHVRLGKFCLKRKLLDEAKAELLQAKKLDPALENEVNTIWAEANDEPVRPQLTPEQTRKIIEEQIARAKTVKEAVGEEVYTLQTDHFVIHTTFARREHEAIRKLSEKLYAGLDRLFLITKNNDRMWDGKCVLYFFKDRDGFVKFSTTVHHFPGQLAGGYFRARGGQCEVVIPKLGGGDRFKETMVHEGTHAFLHFYRAPGRVPRWVQEGTAQYFEFEEFPKSIMLRSHDLTIARAVKAGKVLGLKTLADSDRPTLGADAEAYAWCYSYVSFLIRTDPKKFADFVRGMKSGLECEEALRKSFEWDFDALQKNWVTAVSYLHG
jgi:hypothetical protein